MTQSPDPVQEAKARLARPLMLTWAGMVWERLARAFWLFAAALALVLALRRFGVDLGLWAALALAIAAGFGLWTLRLPKRKEALARLDATLKGRPIAALQDSLALGDSPQSRALWAAHQRQMAAQLSALRAPAPRADLSPRDPFALRLSALTALAVALIFGPTAQVSAPAEAAIGASWEGWAEPPRYTAKPALYLNRLETEAIFVPEGTEFTFRFYGGGTLTQDLADKVETEAGRMQFTAERSGRIALSDGPAFEITLLPDAAPSVSVPALAERRADGRLSQPFEAADDYGVVKGRARVELDLARLDRRYGLKAAPEPRAPLAYDLPMPLSGARTGFSETLVEEAAKHPWANLPVRLVLEVEDQRGQIGTSPAQEMDLPGKRFFDPLASALIELRRDLLWSRETAQMTAERLRAINNRAVYSTENMEVLSLLPALIERLEAGLTSGPLESALRDDLAEALWQTAELLEDGGLDDALKAMQQAQERLSEAIRNGASKDEIAKLMAELKAATDAYIDQLAQNSEEQGPQFGAEQESQPVTGDQIAEMMAEIQRLMEEGKMAEAQEMLDQLAQLMANIQVQKGQGSGAPNAPAMEGLADTLREQQELSDQAFQNLQNGQNDPSDLADQQGELSRELERQRELMPRPGNEAGEAARQRLDEAGRAMKRAEEALRQGDAGRALEDQAEAMQALREGMRDLGRALGGDPAQSQPSDRGAQVPRDPLGRMQGQGGTLGSDDDLMGEMQADKRAGELLDELRKRAGERERAPLELDYLRRLLDQF